MATEKSPIEFPVSEPAEPTEAERTALDEERERHRLRAEKFDVEYVDPAKKWEHRDAARRERMAPPQTIGTGFDIFSTEEQQKQQQRASRFNVQTTGLQWNPPAPADDEEAKKRRERAEKYGTEYNPPDDTGLMDVDLYVERKDAPAEVERRHDAIHVYGVDLMSTNDILRYFGEYGPTYVEWLNDSSCNVQFADAPTAKRAIAGLGNPLPAEQLPEGVDALDIAIQLEFLWHKGPDFIKAGGNIPLIFRIATVDDVKPSERQRSRRLWTSVDRQIGRGRGGRGGGRRYKVRYEHDDRANSDDNNGMVYNDGDGEEGEGGGFKGRGRTKFNRKRKSEGDVEMDDGGEGGGGGRRQQRRRRPVVALDGASWQFRALGKTLGVKGKEGGEGGGGDDKPMREEDVRQPVDYGDL